jgi:hypothetical protein
LSHDTLKTLYGTSDDVVLFWAHHEKLCLVDGNIAFMGGLDMCKWDGLTQLLRRSTLTQSSPQASEDGTQTVSLLDLTTLMGDIKQF